MSQRHLEQIDRLNRICRDALLDLEASRAPELDALATNLTAAFADLEQLGPIDPDDPKAGICRLRLQELDRLQSRLTETVTALHGATGERLAKTARGRRGLTGYRKVLSGARRGARRGQG